ASGTILYFNSATLALEGQISFPASKVVLSADGSLLVAQGASDPAGVYTVQVYDLPAGSLQYTWPYTYNTTSGGVISKYIALSGSGRVWGQVVMTTAGINSPVTYTQEADAPTGGAPIFSTPVNPSAPGSQPPLLRVSPDGTLIATSQAALPYAGLN